MDSSKTVYESSALSWGLTANHEDEFSMLRLAVLQGWGNKSSAKAISKLPQLFYLNFSMNEILLCKDFFSIKINQCCGIVPRP